MEFKKQLTAQRDSLLKDSREQQSKLDVINAQVERLSKASLEAQTKVKELVPEEQKEEERKEENVMDTSAPSEPAPAPEESTTVNGT